MWSSDVSRLTYIIRQFCKKNGKSWQYDKKGNQIKKEIIDPILEYIRENCVEFNIESCGLTKGNILKQMLATTNIIQMIDSGNLANDIVKFIAPEFTVKQLEAIE